MLSLELVEGDKMARFIAILLCMIASHRAQAGCEYLTSGFGNPGRTRLKVEKLVTGLTVPWQIAFVSATEFLVTERPGTLRLVTNGRLAATPILTLPVHNPSESGLLGVAVHPQFSTNRFFYLYYTIQKAGAPVNRVERFVLSNDHQSATFDRSIIDDIPAGIFHDGGGVHFGPDGKLYISTGDGRDPNRSQDKNSPAGKLLRLNDDGTVPSSNPFPGSPAFVIGIRNLQGFTWVGSQLLVADHGPTGEFGRSGKDEINFAKGGDNLGWPQFSGCDSDANTVSPFLVFEQAAPPGGLIHYTGSLIPDWTGSVILATLRSEHLQQIRVDLSTGTPKMVSHEVYLKGTYGRLREATQAPDGSLYVTTTNCDSRGICPADKDYILRITQAP